MESFRWSRWVTIATMLLLAAIAAVVSYSHMYELALRHGEPEWRAALFPLSVDGMIVGASMTLLSDARHGRKGGLRPWALLIVGSGAPSPPCPAFVDCDP
jgi:membrane protease YdiL (CAAX protease family)